MHRALFWGGALSLLVAGLVLVAVRAPGAWAVGSPAPQPIPFSHAIHAGAPASGGIGLECRFCHADSTKAAGAGMPAGEVCLGCHQRVWNVAAQFAPLRAAIADGTATTWSSVSRLPDYVRFHHGAHAGAGVDCATCHGAVETMPRTVKAETLSMGFCIGCHQDPRAQGAQPVGLGTRTIHHAGIEVPPLISCTVCHR